MGVLATDNFNRANGGLGANWTTQSGETAPSIVSNTVQVAGGFVYGARYSAITWPNDQYAQCKAVATRPPTTDEGVGPSCRMATGAQTHYFLQAGAGDTRLYKVVGGSYTQLGTTGSAVAVNDVLYLEVKTSGANAIVTAKVNGVAVCGSPVTDTSPIASGQAGMWLATSDGAANLDDWEGGDLTTALSITPSGLASAEAFGSATVKANWNVVASGIATAETFGAATVGKFVAASGVASAEAFGTAVVALASSALTDTMKNEAGALVASQSFDYSLSLTWNGAEVASGTTSTDGSGVYSIAIPYLAGAVRYMRYKDHAGDVKHGLKKLTSV